MNQMKPGHIVPVRIGADFTVHGRVVSVDEHGDAQVRFRSGTHCIVSKVMPEMLTGEPFHYTGIGRYGV